MADPIEIRVSEASQAAITGTEINWAYTHLYKTLSGNTTFTFANEADAKTIIVAITNDAGDSHTVEWPEGVSWGSSGVPTQRIGGASGATDIYTFTQINGVIYGAVRQ